MNNTSRFLVAATVAVGCMVGAEAARYGEIRPGELWYDDAGHVINAHGGGVMYHNGAYWWYGEHKVYGKEGNRAHVGVHVYSSTDLMNWTDRGVALAVAEPPKEGEAESPIVDGCVIERPKVVFCPKTGKFVMHFHLELKGRGYHAAQLGIAEADVPEGPFTFLRALRPNGEMSRDQTLFVDVDGSAWQICASESNRTTHVNRLTDDFRDFTGEFHRMGVDESTEAAAVCRKGDWYYLIGSGCTGWRPNTARLYRAKSIKGPWERLGNPCTGVNPASGLGADITWGAQSTFILPVTGREGEFIAMFDIWHPANHEESRYVWLPIVFEEDTLTIPWRSAWTPRTAPLPKTESFRFMTFNVYGDYDKRMPASERAAAIVGAVRARRPHFLSLQEINDGWYESPLFPELAKDGYALLRGDEFYALRRAGSDWGDEALRKRAGKKDWCNHEPLVYDTRRFACLESGCEFYHLGIQVQKSVTWGVFEDRTNARRVIAFATHFWWKKGDESVQLRELNARRVVDVVARVQRRWGALPVVGGGDLNTLYGSPALCVFEANGWSNAGLTAQERDPRPTEHGQPEIGVDGKPHGVAGQEGLKGHKIIDHVFYSADTLRALKHEVGVEQSVLDASDHSPVTVDFEFR